MPDAFDMFNLPQREAPEGHSEQATDEKPMVTMTQEQLDAILGAQREESRRNAELWERMLAGPAQRVQEQRPQEPQFEVKLDGLPDPRMDLDGYHKGLSERLSQTYKDMASHALQQASTVQTSQRTQQELYDRAWAALTERDPELAKQADIVQLASSAYVQELQQQGMDPLGKLQRDMDGFVTAVAERGNGIISRIRGEQSESRNQNDGRTKVLSGGSPRRGGKQPEPDVNKPDDLVNSLRAIQREQRIY